MEIIRGTTPTVIFTFDEITPSDIAVAYLTIRQNGTAIIEKDLDAATVSEADIRFTLTQAETLELAVGKGSLVLDWKTSGAVRGRSKYYEIEVKKAGKDEVI